MPYLLGIDVGTTGVKTVLLDAERRVLAATAAADHDLLCPHPGWAEEDPRRWWENVVATVRAVSADSGVGAGQIAGVGVSGMVPALLLLDDRGDVLRPSMQQNDARASREIAELRREIDQSRLYERTGGVTNQQHIAPRARWLQRHEPERWTRARTLCGSYDYLVFRLSGAPSLERNWAIESGLYDIHADAWLPDLLAVAGINPAQLPPVREPTAVVGGITRDASDATGLRAGTPVIAGSADHVASALAAGVRREGDLLIKFGGAGDILYCADRLLTDRRLFIDRHDIPGKWLLNGCMAASGSLVKWFVTSILGLAASSDALRQLDAEAQAVRAGSEGLVILPYFVGEKTPIMDPQARGVFFGLSLHHQRGHVFRAILESVMLGFRHHVEVIESLGLPILQIRATNGGVQSAIWRQIAADVLGRTVRSYRSHPGSAVGVAFLAGKAVGLFHAWSEIDAFLGEPAVAEPDPDSAAVSAAVYRVYRRLYADLRRDFPLLEAFADGPPSLRP